MDHHPKQVRHILSLSGGKDSAALALYMRNRVPEMEYIFNDTRKESRKRMTILIVFRIILENRLFAPQIDQDWSI